MTTYPYILFNQSPEQLRRIGARGGRAYGRNRRARLSAPQARRPQLLPPLAPPVTTVARAIATLDAQFPWLRVSACVVLDSAVSQRFRQLGSCVSIPATLPTIS